MPYFDDAEAVYDTIGKLFVDLASDEELAPKFRTANTIVRYEYSNPDSAITVRLQEGEPVDVDFGESEIKANGPVAKILKLVPLTKILPTPKDVDNTPSPTPNKHKLETMAVGNTLIKLSR